MPLPTEGLTIVANRVVRRFANLHWFAHARVQLETTYPMLFITAISACCDDYIGGLARLAILKCCCWTAIHFFRGTAFLCEVTEMCSLCTYIFNPRRACAARATVLGLCRGVCHLLKSRTLQLKSQTKS